MRIRTALTSAYKLLLRRPFICPSCRLLKHNHTMSAQQSIKAERIYAISDLHVDNKMNRTFVESLLQYDEDVLIVAGDVTDNMTLLKAMFDLLRSKFKAVFYVPGNHELWIRSQEDEQDSFTKFKSILSLCDDSGILYVPQKVTLTNSESVWIVPLFSWYSKPEDDLGDSLYITPSFKENVAGMEKMWMDNHLCVWPSLAPGLTVSKHFAIMNEDAVLREYDAPVISFSHFIPRQDLIRPSEAENSMVEKEREKAGLGPVPPLQGGTKDFNFSRYAGCKTLETQIRTLRSVVHVHGHQHRNRDREIEGTRYVSHCLGYPREQREGWVWGIEKWKGPKQIWPPTELLDC